MKQKILVLLKELNHGLVSLTPVILYMVLIGFPVNGLAKEQPILVFKADYEVGSADHKYQLELYADGNVHYHGERDVNVIGDRYGKITPKQVQKILELYKKVYEKKQKSIAEFMARYEKRQELSQDERSRLEWDKKWRNRHGKNFTSRR